ncbi:ATP synthase B chain [Ligilactobacillus acidipiscis DSM 15836]|uniref:ATP synthase subunit b n=2 Tax=Ligilactobacillus acidipiscis TaxID=89059 RepID=A0A0R2K4Q1_9LACO|nr:F0F1 ATP synthase subunit B [Ligilactobacillus acidipiscis]KRM28221.1 ATP synthase B chain [Ligilactobacillus acidipiscis DSM 15836]KRN84575.1 ATP synthase B chain [Ligilactobacillus acidipiscis]SFV40896.1 ATP synthase F0 sector subunit b [Ligilactobacillus acidipiscis]GAW64116.1 F0F1 ATP synthase subunit B [Ligilactobacillus acidipiscis]GEN21175.1 ATP synthase subunit b [Ligilactobacillus acidipiscis]
MNSTFLLGAAQQIAWGDFLFYLVLFVILMALVGHFAWDPIQNMLQKRADKISNDLDSAEGARLKAEKLAKQREDALSDSHNEASQIVSRAKDNAEQQRTTIVKQANDDATVLKSNAQKDISRQKQEALDGVRNDVAELSIVIASKVIEKELTVDDQKELIDKYIEGLGKQNGAQ